MQKIPYGMSEDGYARCTNVQPGTYSHECGKPATWIGTQPGGFRSCFCDACKERGYEARKFIVKWERIGGTTAERVFATAALIATAYLVVIGYLFFGTPI